MDDDEKLWDHVTKDIEPLKNKERPKGITRRRKITAKTAEEDT